MAKITVTFDGNTTALDQKITVVKANLKSLEQQTVKITVDASGLEAVDKNITRYLNAQARLKEAENAVAVQREKTAQTTQKRLAEEAKLAAQMERTATAEEQARAATQNAAAAQTKQNTAMQEGAKHAGLLGDSLDRIIAKVGVWQILNAAVSAVIRSFTDAVQTLKDVDDQLVTVRKVTNFTTEEMKALEEQAYSTASAYGVAADAFLESVAAFARAGYQDQSAALAELSVKTQLVGDTTAEIANQFLLAVDKAYQFQGSVEKLNAVLDGANEIDNKYATSIEKIADGLGIVAPVAAQLGVGIDELTAMLGTITAVTQRSGSEAARALRSILINLTSDINATFEDVNGEIYYTIGEIDGLSDVVQKYAKDLYDTAKATGQILNPVEVIEALVRAANEADESIRLTEQKLYDLVTDESGKLRAAQLWALIQNWDTMYKSMLGDFGDAVGSTDKEIENAMDSWSRKTAQLKNSWTEFISHLIDTDFVKDGLDLLTAEVEGLDTGVGHLAITVGVAAAAIYGINKAMAANPYLLIIGAVLTAVVTGVGAVNNALKEQEAQLRKTYPELYKLKDALDSTAEAMESIESAYEDSVNGAEASAETAKRYIDILEELEAAGLDTAESQMRYKAAVETVNELIPGLNLLIDETTGRLNMETDAIRSNIDAWKEKTVQQAMQERYDAVYKQRAELMIDRTATELELSQTSNALDSELRRLGRLEIQKDAALSDGDIERYHKLAIQIVEVTQHIEELRADKEDFNATLEATDQKIENLDGEIDRLNGVYDRLVDKTKSAGEASGATAEAIGSLTDSLSKLNEKVKPTFDTLSAAFKDIESDGKISFSTLKKLSEQFKDVSGIDNFIDRLLNLSTSGEDAEKVLTQLALAALDNKDAAEALAGADVELVAAMLEEAGVANADETALDLVTVAKGKLALQTALAEGSIEDFIDVLSSEADASDDAKNALYRLAVQMVETNSTNMSFEQQMEALDALARQAGLTAAALKYTLDWDTAKSRGMTLDAFLANISDPAATIQKYANEIYSALDSAASNSRTSTRYSGGTDTKTGTPKNEVVTDGEEKRLEALLSQAKQYFSYLEASGASYQEQIDAIKQIQDAYHNLAEYVRSTSEYQTAVSKAAEDVNSLTAEEVQLLTKVNGYQTDWYTWLKKIAALHENMVKSAEKLAEEYSKTLKELMDAETAALGNWLDTQENERTAALKAQLDALKAQREAVEDAREEEEKRLAVEKARLALENAERERTVRVYNAAAGQWEWVADAKTVADAREALAKANEDLSEYYAEREYQAAVKELEKQTEYTKSAFSEMRSAIEYAAQQIKDGSMSFSEAYDYIEAEMKRIYNEYGVDLTGVMELSVQGFQNVQNGIDELYQNILEKMKANSEAWYTAKTQEERDSLHAQNLFYSGITGLSYDSTSGAYTDSNGNVAYTVSGSSGQSVSSTSGTGSTPYTAKDANGNTYTIGSDKGINFVQNAAPGSTLGLNNETSDGSIWTKNADGSVTISAQGTTFTVKSYDSGGVLRGLGGIKATERDELVLPPDLTEKILKPQRTPEVARAMRELGIIYGGVPQTNVTNFGGNTDNRVGTQYNGGVFVTVDKLPITNVTTGTTLGEIAQAAQNLALYSKF